MMTRRALLERLGLAAGLVPLLAGRRARAAERPKRLIVITVPNGYTPDYSPVVDGASWKAAAVEFSPLAPLEPYKDRLLVLGGINLQNGTDTARQVKANPTAGLGGHASLPFLLTGAKGVPGPAIPDGWSLSAGHASVDQHVAQHMPGASARPFSSLVLRPVRMGAGGYGNEPLSYAGPCLDGRTHNAPSIRDDPSKLFADLFGTPGDTAALDRLRLERRSLLDFTTRQLRTLQSKVGKDDKLRIEHHLEGVASIERRLQGAGAPACTLPAKPDPAIWIDKSSSPSMPQVMRAQMEMTVAAMACDLTRVASHSWCQANNNTITFPWLADKIPSLLDKWEGTEMAGSGNDLRNHHTIAHNEGMLRREKNLADQFFIESFAYFIKLLSERTDPDGRPMIESTLVLYANQQRTGGGHQTDNLIWFLAGNCDGYFKTGRYLPWLSGKANQAAPTNGVLAALVNATGCPPVEYFGDPQYGGEAPTLRA